MRVGKPGPNIYETLGRIVEGLEKEEMKREARPPSWKILLAFAIIYFVWGSTFLAIRIGVHEVPPFLLAAMRFFTAGLVLYAWLRLKGTPAPIWRE